MSIWRAAWIIGGVALAACSGPVTTTDGGDAGLRIDAGDTIDAAPVGDAATPREDGAPDAGAMDAGAMDAGAIDAGAIDAGAMDAGAMDAGAMDAGAMDAGLACPPGQLACGGACVDPRTDRLNCGACGAACPAGQMCAAGACALDCPAPGARCIRGGVTICADTQSDPTNCGTCGRACLSPPNAAPGCAMGACGVGTCNAGFGNCDAIGPNGCETNLLTSALHCGRCGNRCVAAPNSSSVCAAGACVFAGCSTFYANCDGDAANGCEVLTSTDTANCGACGRRCAPGETCAAGRCAGPPPVGTGSPTFQIRSLGTAGCRLIDHAGVTGDDRGGIALSGARVFYTGDLATGAFDRQSLTGSAVPGMMLDALASDVRTQTAYTFGAVSGLLPSGGGGATRLIALDPVTGAPSPNEVALSTVIPFGGNTMIGSGWGRIVVLTNGRAYDIVTPSGRVTDLGPIAVPAARTGCESWATWGTAEYFGGQLFIDYVSSRTTISRMAIPSGAITTIGTYDDLADMCSFVVSPWNNRWYWQHEGPSQFGGVGESIGFCDAAFTTDALEITGLSTARCTAVEHVATTGDDRGGIAVTSANVLYSGDVSTGRFALTGLGSAAALGRVYDVLVTDLGTQTAYAFTSLGEPGGPPGVDGVVALDANGAPTGPVVSLPRTIAIGAGGGVFSGAGRAVIVTGGRAVEVDLASGGVADLGPFSPQNPVLCDGWNGYFGVAELIDGERWLTYVARDHRVVRQRVGSTATQLVAAFPPDVGLADMCSFTVAPALDRWYFHYEANGFARAGDETLGYCDASINRPAAFRMTSLGGASGAGCTSADVSLEAGDDRGPIGVSFAQAFLTGDRATARADVVSLARVTSLGRIEDTLVSNLATGQVFALADAAGNAPVAVGLGIGPTVITQLIELDGATGARTLNRVALTAPITVAGSGASPTSAAGLYSGWNRVVLHVANTVTNIDLPSGRVTVVHSGRPQPTRTLADNWATAGVAEFFAGQLHLTYPNANGVRRLRVTDGVESTVQMFSDLGDMASFTFAPHRDRWYHHTEGASEFGLVPEALTFCPATYSGAP